MPGRNPIFGHRVAQTPVGGGPGPVLGIVEIPKMFAVDKDTGLRAPQGALRLYSGPDSEGKMLTDIRTLFRITPYQ